MATEHVNPEPGEIAETIIAETIIAEFYAKRIQQEKEWRTEHQVEKGTAFSLEWSAYVHQQRLEEMLKRIWFLLLEQKAERSGFDDTS